MPICEPCQRVTTISQRIFSACIPERGLSDYLTGQAEIEDLLVNPGIERLTMLPGRAGPWPTPQNIWVLQGWKPSSKRLRERYCEDRIVIFDSPPCLHQRIPWSSHAAIDAVLLVVEAERTTSNDLSVAWNCCQGYTILGTVFNK